MKKLLAMLMALVMALSMTTLAFAETDKEYVVNKGVLVVGITDFAPMDYKDAEGNWIGFDADLAKAFAAELGVKVEFVEIDWDNKILELDGKAVDCIWNGMTLTDAVKNAMACSKPYMNNAQVVVVPVDQAEKYQSVESLTKLAFAVEAGSAGEAEVSALGLSFTPVATQADALMEVAAFTSDAAVIDALLTELAIICPVRILSYDAGEKKLDNTVFYLSFADEMRQLLDLTQEQTREFIYYANLAMQLLDEKGESPSEAFAYISRFAHFVAEHGGAAYECRITCQKLTDRP